MKEKTHITHNHRVPSGKIWDWNDFIIFIVPRLIVKRSNFTNLFITGTTLVSNALFWIFVSLFVDCVSFCHASFYAVNEIHDLKAHFMTINMWLYCLNFNVLFTTVMTVRLLCFLYFYLLFFFFSIFYFRHSFWCCALLLNRIWKEPGNHHRCRNVPARLHYPLYGCVGQFFFHSLLVVHYTKSLCICRKGCDDIGLIRSLLFCIEHENELMKETERGKKCRKWIGFVQRIKWIQRIRRNKNHQLTNTVTHNTIHIQ